MSDEEFRKLVIEVKSDPNFKKTMRELIKFWGG